MRALQTAATGMMAQELNVQVISNNIANLRTTGYKRQQAHFQDLLYENFRRAGAATSDQNTRRSGRHRARLGREDVVDRPRHEPGQPGLDREGIRCRDPGRGPLQDPDAGRAHGLHPRRLLRSRRARPARHPRRLPGRSRHHRPAERQLGDDQRHGTVEAILPGQLPRRRSGRSSSPASSTSRASNPSATTSFSRPPPRVPPSTATRTRKGSGTCSRTISKKRT